MIKIEELNSMQRDVLKEIGNIGAGHAATALAQLLRERINMTVPDVSIVPLSRLHEVLGGTEELVVGIYMKVFGDAPSKLIFLFNHQEAVMLVNMVLGTKTEDIATFGDLEESVLREISNIMTGAYLNALAVLTDLNLLPSVPAYACDMSGALLDAALLDGGVIDDYALLIETQFSLTNRQINGHFFLVPEPGALDAILTTLGV
ncbi:MAG TPA: chemotaxis protein CheC [Bacillota bacterium]|nr:chemotaxis protein CheC [Bacillota bacterium]